MASMNTDCGFLSSLPRDLLEMILDRVTIEDVAKFGTLSRSWKRLRSSFFPFLVLNPHFLEEFFINGNTSDYSLLLEKLHGVLFLYVHGSFLKDYMPPTKDNTMISLALHNLRHLVLDAISFDDWVHPSCILALLNSCPNLQTLLIQASSSGDVYEDAYEMSTEEVLRERKEMPNLVASISLKITGIRGLVLECNFIRLVSLRLAKLRLCYVDDRRPSAKFVDLLYLAIWDTGCSMRIDTKPAPLGRPLLLADDPPQLPPTLLADHLSSPNFPRRDFFSMNNPPPLHGFLPIHPSRRRAFDC